MHTKMKRVKEDIAKEFDAFSSDYTSDMIRCVPHYLNLVEYQTRRLPADFRPARILDLGCGNGNLSVELSALYPKASYILADISEEMLRLSLQRMECFATEVQLKSFDQLEFEDASLDLVVAGFSLHHVPAEQKRAVFDKMARWLRKGGIFAYGDLMINKSQAEHISLLIEWESFVLGNYPDEEKWLWLMEHYDNFDSPDNFYDQIQWLEKAGFSSVRIAWQESYWTCLYAVR